MSSKPTKRELHPAIIILLVIEECPRVDRRSKYGSVLMKKTPTIGVYDTPKEAAIAYDHAVIKYDHPKHKLNFPNYNYKKTKKLT